MARAKFLIAYNVFLNTPDVDIAKKIAKAVRFSSGGLRFVKGAGFLVRGLAQVSMNLTDFEQTPIHRVFEFVKREAARYGVIPVSSEIVGLIPKKALEQAAEWFLQVENFDSSLILENRLSCGDGRQDGRSAACAPESSPSSNNWPLRPRLPEEAAPPPPAEPWPPDWQAWWRPCRAARKRTCSMKASSAKRSPGSASFAKNSSPRSMPMPSPTIVVMKAYKSAKESSDGDAAISAALKQATSVPLGVAEKVVEVAEIAPSLKPITNPNMKSDLTTAIALARAALEGALANVEINLDSLKDAKAVCGGDAEESADSERCSHAQKIDPRADDSSSGLPPSAVCSSGNPPFHIRK